MSKEETRAAHGQVSSSSDRPPVGSPLYAAVWWLTRPWLNTAAIATPIAAAGGVVMLSVYLGSIHCTGLLPQAISSSSGLLLIVVAALLFAIVWAITILGSAFFIHSVSEIYDGLSVMPPRLPKALFVWMAAWWALLFVDTFQSDEHLAANVVGLLFGVVACSVLLHVVEHLRRGWAKRGAKRCFAGIAVIPQLLWQSTCSAWRLCCSLRWRSTRIDLGHRISGALAFPRMIRELGSALSTRYRQIGIAALVGVLVGLAVWFALVVAALAPLDVFAVIPSLEDAELNWVSALAWVGASVPGPLVGWLYVNNVARGRNVAEGRRRIAWITIGIAGVFVLASLRPISLQVLRALGIYSTSETRFAISSPAVLENFKAAGMEVVTTPLGDAATRAPTAVEVATHGRNTAVATIDAFVRFRFGGQLVLCTTPFDPLRSPRAGSKWAEKRGKRVVWRPGRCLDVPENSAQRVMPDPSVRDTSAPAAGSASARKPAR